MGRAFNQDWNRKGLWEVFPMSGALSESFKGMDGILSKTLWEKNIHEHERVEIMWRKEKNLVFSWLVFVLIGHITVTEPKYFFVLFYFSLLTYIPSTSTCSRSLTILTVFVNSKLCLLFSDRPCSSFPTSKHKERS